MEKKFIVLIFFSMLLVMPFILAYDYGSPAEMFTWEWSKFGIVFFLLFASIYRFFNKRMNNTPVSAIIGLCLAALITVPIMRRGLLDPFFNPQIIDWIVFIAIIAGIFFLLYRFVLARAPGEPLILKKLAFKIIIFFGVLVILFYLIGEYLPSSIIYSPIGDWINVIEGFGVTTIIILAIILIAVWLWGRHAQRRTYGWEGYYKTKAEQKAKMRAMKIARRKGTGYRGMGPGAGI